jgi:hypothetical protein
LIATEPCPESPVLLDVRGNLTLAVLALDAWAIETLGHTQGSLDANLAAWVAAGKPQHVQVNRVLARLRAVLTRLGQVPSWFPPSLLKALEGEAPSL